MRFAESVLAGGPWIGVALVQATLVALLGCLAWLAARRGGPALRAAILLAALFGLLAAPVFALVAPVWLSLPEWLCPIDAEPSTDSSDGVPERPPADATVFALLVPQPSEKDPPNPEESAKKSGETAVSVKAEAVVFKVVPPAEDPTPPPRPNAPPRASWSLEGIVAALWIFGAAVYLSRALVRLTQLYHRARQARPIRDQAWTDCLASLMQSRDWPAVVVRESGRIASPLTLGLIRPMILLPRCRHQWSAEQRVLILRHELAHILRRDFFAGLVAELAACLCWFHPLVRWLARRLRLEQEYAADAWVAATATDPAEYVRCLARLALELDRGAGPLAPAFWRRRPEIMRRIDMLRRNPKGLPHRLGKRAGWTVAVLMAASCLAAGGVGPLHSAAEGRKSAANVPEAKNKATADRLGDPLPAGALARMGTTRLRHGSEVTFVAFGPEGKTLLTAGRDNTVRLWDLATGKEIRRYAPPTPAKPKPQAKKNNAKKNQVDVEVMMMMGGGGNDGGSPRIALTADGKTLAYGRGNAIQIYNVETGESLARIETTINRLLGLLFSPDGKTLAARSGNNTLFLWATESGKEICRIEPPPRPKNATLAIFLSGGGDGGNAPGMAFLPDGKTLVAAATDRKKEAVTHSVKFWDAATGKEIRKIEAAGNVGVVAVAPGGEVGAYSIGNILHLCEVKSGKKLRQIQTPNGITALSFSPDGKTLAIRGRNQRAGLWEIETGKEIHHLSDAQIVQRSGSGFVFYIEGFSVPETRALAVSADGKRVVAAAGSTVRLWEIATGKELPLSEGHRQAPSAIVLAKDGKTMISWGGDRVIRRWDATAGKLLGSYLAPAGTTRAALSPDGSSVALANADNTIRLHDAATGKELHRFKTHPNGTIALAFAPDGKVLASRGGTDNIIRLYDVAAGRELRQIAMRKGRGSVNANRVELIVGMGGGSGGGGAGLAFSPDGKLIVAPGPGGRRPGNALLVFDVASGKELRKIELSQSITSMAFSPDGRTLATENADRTITLWEIASGKKRVALGNPASKQPRQTNATIVTAVFDNDGADFGSNEPAGPIGLAFSPDGRALAVRGADRSIRVWDVSAGKEVGRFKGHSGRIETVAFAPDGQTLASGASDTTLLIWDAASPLKELAKAQPVELPVTDLENAWSDLAGDDAAKALRHVLKMTAAPRQTVAFLSERLKPAARIDPKKIAGWIADMESDKFRVRQGATANLLKIGEQAVPALRKVLTSTPTLETRKRVEDMLEKLTGGTLNAELLRVVRAVEVLERIGTPAALKILRTLAQGAPGTLPTREAESALHRLEQTKREVIP